MSKRNVLLWTGIGYFALAGSGFAATYNLTCIPPPLLQQNCDDGSAQTSVVVTEPSPGQVLFTFFSVGSIPMKISGVYFDDMNTVLQGPMTIIEAGNGIVNFSEGGAPTEVPRWDQLTPDFVSELRASRAGNEVNAVDPGESVGIQLAIAGGKTFADVLNDLGSGALRIAEHVINFASTNGGSESFVNTATPLGPSADLTVSKFGPTALETGQTTMYLVIVQNNGPDSADNVTMTDDVPSGMTIVWVDQSQGVCSHTTTQVTCNLGTVPNGQFEYVIIQVTAPSTAGTITNSASVSSTTTDTAPANNSDTVQTTVTSSSGPIADLSVTKTASPDPVAQVGENVTYTVAVTNNGPDTATGAVMLDLLPQAVNLLSVTPSQGSCQPPLVNGTLECNIGTLTNGASMTVTVVVQTTLAGLIGNSASVFADQDDPNFSNNVTGMVVTNVGDVSRLINISTRAPVGTGDNVLIGGFILGGNLPKTVFVRVRGPSLVEFGVSGSIADPYVELYSGSTMIARNDNWQITDPLCLAPATACGNAAQIANMTLNPCAIATVGCTLDSAILVTLPPGPYTAIVRGVGGGTGVANIGVFDVDPATLPKMVNISTRGQVLTGDSVMIGGFIIGAGTGNKTVLLRVRGPSLVDFGVAGPIANPYVELYSGSTKIAQNNDWQTTDALCLSPAVSCGTAAEIENTSLDPCSVTPTSCALDSAILVTLPPGPYTAIVRGVGGVTGIANIGVFELSP